jgi:bacillolysin
VALTVEHFAKGNGSDSNPSDEVWLIGDEIDRRSGSAALRSMSNPTSLGQPDTYGGQYWQNPNCGTPTQANDYCGVHTNSGVLNYWFYLLVEGGNGTNDVGDVFSVSSIGMDKSAKIAYRTLNNYLSANSTFANARAGAIQAAKDLYGAGGAEEQAVTNAWHAVNVGDAFGGGNGGSNYCASNGNSTADEYISRVQLADINNTSGAGNGGYQNHTAVETDLAKGDPYTVTITPTWTGTVYSEGYAVWIDYNQDGDFSDSGELVTSVAATQNTPVSGSFTVPTNATDGATRMRVSMKYNAVPGACESFSYGEVEDYTVNIGSSAADTLAPSTPTSLGASDVTQTTVDLSWTASNDNVGVTGYDVFQGNTNLGSVTNTTANITGLTASTAYTFKVRAKDAANNTSGFSNIVNVTTQGNSLPPTGYCSSNGQSVSDEYIQRVQIGSINNSSGASSGGYGDFTNFSTTLGESNTITITPAWTGTVYSEGYAVWVDFNRDGDFGDTGELVYSRSATTASSVSGTFSVPAGALTGATRMRVSMKYNGIPTSCESFRWGEVEDYIVNIGTTPEFNQVIAGAVTNALPEQGVDSSFSIYPNPIKGSLLNISFVYKEQASFSIHNLLGQEVANGKLSNSINVNQLESGIYILNATIDGRTITKRFIKK